MRMCLYWEKYPGFEPVTRLPISGMTFLLLAVLLSQHVSILCIILQVAVYLREPLNIFIKYKTMVIPNIEIILFLNVSTTLKSSSGVD